MPDQVIAVERVAEVVVVGTGVSVKAQGTVVGDVPELKSVGNAFENLAEAKIVLTDEFVGIRYIVLYALRAYEGIFSLYRQLPTYS